MEQTETTTEKKGELVKLAQETFEQGMQESSRWIAMRTKTAIGLFGVFALVAIISTICISRPLIPISIALGVTLIAGYLFGIHEIPKRLKDLKYHSGKSWEVVMKHLSMLIIAIFCIGSVSAQTLSKPKLHPMVDSLCKRVPEIIGIDSLYHPFIKDGYRRVIELFKAKDSALAFEVDELLILVQLLHGEDNNPMRKELRKNQLMKWSNLIPMKKKQIDNNICGLKELWEIGSNGYLVIVCYNDTDEKHYVSVVYKKQNWKNISAPTFGISEGKTHICPLGTAVIELKVSCIE